VLSDLIPRIYLDFMRGGPPERLVPVFHHNQMDPRGLAALSSRVHSLVSDAENVGQDGLELFGVSRICEKRGENARAPVSSMRNRLRPSCRPKQIGQHGTHSPDLRSAKAISI
jgi:hypothetical protein